jgi:ribosomal-protein-alanine acetyltransferase
VAAAQIRPMNEADLDAVQEMELRCFADPWSRRMLEAEVARLPARQLLAEQNGAIAGYVFLQHVLDEGEITNIAVSPDFRRQGIGGELMRAAIAQAKEWELRCLLLEVRESNRPAIALYERFGFLADGKRPGYYRHPKEDAVLMRLELR